MSVRDTGEYKCMAENIAGRATHTVQLEVFGKIRLQQIFKNKQNTLNSNIKYFENEHTDITDTSYKH